ncbi:peroxidase ycdB, partial [Yersinia pestis PY-19]
MVLWYWAGRKLPKPQIVDHLMSLEPKMSVGKNSRFMVNIKR